MVKRLHDSCGFAERQMVNSEEVCMTAMRLPKDIKMVHGEVGCTTTVRLQKDSEIIHGCRTIFEVDERQQKEMHGQYGCMTKT